MRKQVEGVGFLLLGALGLGPLAGDWWWERWPCPHGAFARCKCKPRSKRRS